MNRFVYHYCAQFQEDNSANISYIDGIAQMTKRITCQGDHLKLKKLIEPEFYSRLTLVNLSFLGMEK
jgi:hypothetical protein